MVGAAAEALESMTEEQVAARATAVLRGMFGAAQVPDAVGCSFSAWHREPFTRGSWSFIPQLHRNPFPLFAKKSLSEHDARSNASFIRTSTLTTTTSSAAPASVSSALSPSIATSGNAHTEFIDFLLRKKDGVIADCGVDCGADCGVDTLVHYAGEADCPEQRGTVHGAYLSGQAAAQQLLNDMQ